MHKSQQVSRGNHQDQISWMAAENTREGEIETEAVSPESGPMMKLQKRRGSRHTEDHGWFVCLFFLNGQTTFILSPASPDRNLTAGSLRIKCSKRLKLNLIQESGSDFSDDLFIILMLEYFLHLTP